MIHLQNLTFTYNTTTQPAIQNINLHIPEGQFILLTGPSGCGKSTLCRTLNGLIPHFYGGTIHGTITINHQHPIHTPTYNLAKTIGMVFQNPENQLITTEVEREIAFGLEQHTTPPPLIAKRIEETLATIGITHLRNRHITTLSGGEKQQTAIAAALAHHPQILVLDEPTSELDPKSAENILHTLTQLNQDFGITIILVEHRIDRVLHLADRLLIMQNGQISYDGTPTHFIQNPPTTTPITLPPITQLAHHPTIKPHISTIPLTVKQARAVIKPLIKQKTQQKKQKKIQKNSTAIPLINIRNLTFQFTPENPILSNITTSIYSNEFVSIIGRNATGKTTLARLLIGLLSPTKGIIEFDGKNIQNTKTEYLAKDIGYVFQDPNTHLFSETVEEEICFKMKNLGYTQNEIEISLNTMINQFHLASIIHTHPHDLSTGEKQRVALASVLCTQPKLLILDEPTRGLDHTLKHELMKYLSNYQNKGGTILLISHDIELIAEHTERVILLGDNTIIADGSKNEVLAQSLYFSPQINRLVKPIAQEEAYQNILTVQDFIEVFG